jgi:hypothetical protein
VFLLLNISLPAQAGQGGLKVDCAAGETIGKALARDNGRRAGQENVVIVLGTCNEHLLIDVDDLTLQADPAGATVNGPNPTINTITVRANRITIDGLNVTGGLNGIAGLGASLLNIKNCRVNNARQSGIVFSYSASGTVDACTVQSNGLHGITVESGMATVINSRVALNGGMGIFLTHGAGGRIGITDALGRAPNTISNNGNSGIHVVRATASIGGNVISGNGTNLDAALGAYGILITRGSASIAGGNTITNNAGSGIFVNNNGSIFIGDPGFGPPTTNTISGNGASFLNNGGVLGVLGATMIIRDAAISGNTGNGITLNLRSSGQMSSSSITGNVGNGVFLGLGGGLLLQTPAVTITGNNGWGLQCADAESSFFGDASAIGTNVLGSISPNCTGF